MDTYEIRPLLFLVHIIGLSLGQVEDYFILAADSHYAKVHQISLSTGNVVQLPISGLTSPKGVLIDKDDKYIFVADYGAKEVVRCTLPGYYCSTFSTGKGYPERLAIDYSTGHIYYTADPVPTLNEKLGYIGVINPTKNSHFYVLEDMYRPRGIALYPSKGKMFWTDYASPKDYIAKSNMDGTGKEVIITSFIYTPNGITIDYNGDRIYWVDGNYNNIQSSDLNGDSRLTHITDGGANMRDIILQGSYFYYSGYYRNVITKVRKSDFTVQSWMSDTAAFGRINQIAILPQDTQPTHSLCSDDNGGCKEFCLPKGAYARTCKCDGGIGLNYNRYDDTCLNGFQTIRAEIYSLLLLGLSVKLIF